MFTTVASTMVSFNYSLIYDRPLIKSGKRVDYTREMTFPVNLFDSTLYFFPFVLDSPPLSYIRSILPPFLPRTPPRNVPIASAAKFNVRQVSGSRETPSLYFSNRDFDASVYSSRSPVSPLLPLASHHGSPSLYFFASENEIGAIARFHLQSGTKPSMLNLIS